MINLEPKQIQLLRDSLNIISIKGIDAKYVANLQTILEDYLSQKLEELNLQEKSPSKSKKEDLMGRIKPR